jgi:ACDE family multidrug resistance protein
MGISQQLSVKVFGEDGTILTDSKTQSLIVASSSLIMGVMLVSPLVADLAGVYGVSSGAAGWLIIAFTAAAAVTLLIVAPLADVIGRKTVMVTGLVLFGLAGGVISITTRFDVAVVLRGLQGVGFASTMPIILTMFGEMYDESAETTVQGMRVAANSVVASLAPLLAGVLFVASWWLPFALYLAALPVALWVWVAVPDVGAANDWSIRTYLRKIASFLTSGRISLLMLSFGLRFAVFYVLLTYFSVLATEEAGLSVVVVGTLLSLIGVVKIIGASQAGRLAAAYDPTLLSVSSFVCMTIGVTAMGALSTPSVMVVGLFIFAVGDGVLAPIQKSLINRVAPAEYRGGANASALVFENVGKVLGPFILGLSLSLVDLATAFVLVGGLYGSLGSAALLGFRLVGE